MRHLKAKKKLGTGSSHRKAILRNMVTSLFKHGQVETTDAKAKQMRPVAERMITLAKRGDLHARRQALGFLQEKPVAHKLFGEIKDRYTDRQGGYVRIVKKGVRRGDGAPLSIVQLVQGAEGSRKPKRKWRSQAEAPRKAEPKSAQAESPPEGPGEAGKPEQGGGAS